MTLGPSNADNFMFTIKKRIKKRTKIKYRWLGVCWIKIFNLAGGKSVKVVDFWSHCKFPSVLISEKLRFFFMLVRTKNFIICCSC